MTHATFVDNDTSVGNRVDASFLNDINTAVYIALGAAGVAPTTTTGVIDNLATAISAKLFTALTATSIQAGTLTAIADSSFTSTGALQIPVGTTGNRPTAAVGKVRYNSSLTRYEGYKNSAWQQLGGGATGGGSDEIFVENGQTVTTDYAIPSGRNAMSTGPILVNAGITVTIPAGARWVVL